MDVAQSPSESSRALHVLLPQVESLIARDGPLPIIELIDTCVREAYTLHASDIHFIPEEDTLTLRLRIDGILHDAGTLPKSAHESLIARIKVLAHLRSDEHHTPHDGRFRYHIADTPPIDIRVSIVPTYYGENAVLRILGGASTPQSLTELGMGEKHIELITRAIQAPHGMVLATGPTGSGKTTTLYTLLSMRNTRDVSIITIEDPIEYAIPGITQIPVHARGHFTFAQGLRSILRQDPNIIMVGEIRDSETASIAVNTALTGHLLLSSIHTNNACTTLPRLLDMGIDAYLVASTVRIAIGQRLVRRVCKNCAVSQALSSDEQAYLSRDAICTVDHISRGSGCDACDHTGYRGRVGLYEVLPITPRIRDAVLAHASSERIAMIAREEGMQTMQEHGLMLIRKGVSTPEEVRRSTILDE